ncbi:hypothetical protein KCP71_05475 [Salmonella enterica subsp. enterica]|nr:hypothetical protein KCP71_05475 [Salmonella enterica subsp. enterica]
MSGRYAAEDAIQLHLKMWPELQQHKASSLNVFENIEMPLVPVLSRVERNGVKRSCRPAQTFPKEITLRPRNWKRKRMTLRARRSTYQRSKAADHPV